MLSQSHALESYHVHNYTDVSLGASPQTPLGRLRRIMGIG
jgi:hypothetical protein